MASRWPRRRYIRFNSRTREGCDRWVRPPHHEFFQFQFTHPGGVRLFDELLEGFDL